jgi:hypothetical protein
VIYLENELGDKARKEGATRLEGLLSEIDWGRKALRIVVGHIIGEAPRR